MNSPGFFSEKFLPCVNHEDFDDVKKIKPWIMIFIIKNGENVNHAGFDDVKKNLLDKGGECESCIS